MRITEHISTLPSAVQPEVKAVIKESVMSVVAAVAGLVSIVTLGCYQELGEWLAEQTYSQSLPQNLFLIVGTTLSPTFRENLDSGAKYRKVVGDDYSEYFNSVFESNPNSRMGFINFALKISWATIHDFSIGIFKTIHATLLWFTNEEINKEAMIYLGSLNGFHGAAMAFSCAIGVNEIKQPEPRRPLLE